LGSAGASRFGGRLRGTFSHHQIGDTMAFITNQWLKGDAERNRGHSPVQVTMSPAWPSDSWSQNNAVHLQFQITKSDGDYQAIYFTKAEQAELLGSFAHNADLSALKDVAFKALLRLDDADLLNFLQILLSRRVSEPGLANKGGA